MRGWKVAGLKPDLALRWGTERIAGPVFDIWDASSERPSISIIEGGYAAAEAEFQLLIGAIPGGPEVAIEQAGDAISTVRIGVEIAGSPYAAINAHGPAVTVSDFGNNLGLVLGSEIPEDAWQDGFRWTVHSILNGQPAGNGVAADAAGGPIEAARFLFGLTAQRGLPIEAGQWISAGAITGGHRIASGDAFEARFGDSDAVGFRIF